MTSAVIAGFLALVLGVPTVVGLGARGLRDPDWRTWKAVSDAEICRRADEQHRQVLADDPRGTYGWYPPATVVGLGLTGWENKR